MSVFFTFPKSAAFGRVLPKSKIYDHADITAATKAHFVSQVDQIVWAFKLAPETINLTPTKSVAEIQVFKIALKTGELSPEVLRAIDRAIPYPIIFELHIGGRLKTIAAYKRPSEADSAKWVVSDYFESEWAVDDSARATLPVALNLGGLYEKLLAPLLPHAALDGESLGEHVTRLEQVRAREREVDKIKARLSREKQFNRRVEINAELRDVNSELQQLMRGKVQTG
jgi:Domain of unknown function (DUF4391)